MAIKYFDLKSLILGEDGKVDYTTSKPTVLDELELDLVSGGYESDYDPSTNDGGCTNALECSKSKNKTPCTNPVSCPGE